MTERLARLRELLDTHGVGAYVSLSAPVNQYLSGFRGSTSAIIVTRSKAIFLCDFRYGEQAAAQIEGFEVEVVTGRLAHRAGERLSQDKIRHTAYEPEAMVVADLQAIKQVYRGVMESRPGFVGALRAIKSPVEIECIRRALALSEEALSDVLESLVEGMTERELAARMEYQFRKLGASGASFPTIALFGPRTSLPHGEPEDNPLTPGDIVLLDFGCRLDGYCSDLTRTYAFGTIPGIWFDEVYDLVLTAQRIALEAIRPGMLCREADAVARQLIQDAGHGAHFGHGLGHGLGIEIHEGPRLGVSGEILLEPGMVVTIEPGVYLPGWGGVRIEDVVAITQDGCTVLSRAPKELRIIHP